MVLIFVHDDTINGQNSHSMLKGSFVPDLKRFRKASSAISREDRTPPHFRRDVRQYFDKAFLNRWIGRDGAHKKIYKSPIPNLDELKIKIIENI